MTQSIQAGERRWHTDPITRIATLVPFALAIGIDLLFKPLSGSGIFAKPPEVIGLPAGVWIQLASVAWAAVGAWFVWTTSSRAVAMVAFVFGTVLSALVIVLTPAFIAIWQRLPG